jgi:hypothetical protein
LNPRPRECHSRALPLSYGPRFLFNFKLKFFFCQATRGGLFKKVPLYFIPPNAHFFVLPSDSEASLTSFGTASRHVSQRHVSAEGPLACARGDKRVGSGRQKRRSGRQKSRLRMDKNGRGLDDAGLILQMA